MADTDNDTAAGDDERETIEGFPYPPILVDPEKPDAQFADAEITTIEVYKQQEGGRFSILTKVSPHDLPDDLALLEIGSANSKNGDGTGVYKLCGRCAQNKVRAWRHNVAVGDFAPKKLPAPAAVRAPAAAAPASSSGVAFVNLFGALAGLVTAATPIIMGMVDGRRAREQAGQQAITDANNRVLEVVASLAKARNDDMAQLLEQALKARRGGEASGATGDVTDLLDAQKAMYEDMFERVKEFGGGDDTLSKLLEAAVAGWATAQANAPTAPTPEALAKTIEAAVANAIQSLQARTSATPAPESPPPAADVPPAAA